MSLVRGPQYATAASAGMDLFLNRTVEILPGQVVRVEFGNGRGGVLVGADLGMTPGQYCQIHPRSSSFKLNVTIHSGIIDADYPGELGGLIRNNGEHAIQLEENTSVCQIVYSVCTQSNKFPVSPTVRTGGFGSTGNTPTGPTEPKHIKLDTDTASSDC